MYEQKYNILLLYLLHSFSDPSWNHGALDLGVVTVEAVVLVAVELTSS